jgi:mono/diheme cytochrome c family protein
MKLKAKKLFVRVCGMAAVTLIAAATSLVVSKPAAATEQYAKQTGKSCAACHQNPKGGGALTPDGEKFKATEKKPPKAPQ